MILAALLGSCEVVPGPPQRDVLALLPLIALLHKTCGERISACGQHAFSPIAEAMDLTARYGKGVMNNEYASTNT